MLGLNKTTHQLAMENGGHLNMLRKDGHVLRRTLQLEVGGQRKKER